MGEMKILHTSTHRIESPITLEEIKDHLNITRGETGQDETLKGLRAASVEMAQNITGRKLMIQKWTVYLDNWPSGNELELPFTPLASSGSVAGTSSIPTTGIYYTDSTNGSTTLGSTAWSYDAVSEPPRIVLGNDESWPTDILHHNNPIQIRGTYGYSASSEIPRSIKHAMLLMIGHWYENRENTIIGAGQVVHEIPLGAKSLLEMYRVKWF